MEDLTPYLENSNVLYRDDYLENVLAGYTYDNKLAAIPNSFSVETMAGKSSDLGGTKGWTLEEVLAYAKEHPEAKLFYGANESSIMEFCMSSNMDLFLDWESGEVRFDSEIFMELLEYLKSYQENVSSKPDDREPPERLQSGDCLLYPVSLHYFNDIQLYPAMFDQPVTYIGYPTADGSANAVMRCDKLYGISAASGNKEGAWVFIEHCLTEPVEWGFSPRRSQLEVQIEEAKEAAKNSSGETLFDEGGNPLPAHGEKGVKFGFSGWEYTYHACTDEEIDQVKELLEVAKPVKNSDNLVMAIIEEEVQAFYVGQKSAEDVAKIIQSRVQLYVDENR